MHNEAIVDHLPLPPSPWSYIYSPLSRLNTARGYCTSLVAAQIKLVEAWKATHLDNYPMQLEKNQENLLPNARELSPTTTRLWREDGKSNAARESFARNAAKIWNRAPVTIKEANTLTAAKKN